MITKDDYGNPGLSIETASSVILRDMIRDYFKAFQYVIRRDRAVSQKVVGGFVDGLAGAMALTVAAGHGSREEVLNSTVAELRNALDRDLKAWERQHAIRRT